jgi:hypothetical protein
MESLLSALGAILLLGCKLVWLRRLPRLARKLEPGRVLRAVPWVLVWWVGAFLGRSELSSPLLWGLLIGALLPLHPEILFARQGWESLMQAPEMRAFRDLAERKLPEATGGRHRCSFSRSFAFGCIATQFLMGAVIYFLYRLLGSRPGFLTGLLISYSAVTLLLAPVLLRRLKQLAGEDPSRPGEA